LVVDHNGAILSD
jgi:hypothetical protein